jgi:hypothetical protein
MIAANGTGVARYKATFFLPNQVRRALGRTDGDPRHCSRLQSDGRDLAGRGTYGGGFTGSSAEHAGAQVSRTTGPGKDADADSQSLAAAWVGWQNSVPLPGAR